MKPVFRYEDINDGIFFPLRGTYTVVALSTTVVNTTPAAKINRVGTFCDLHWLRWPSRDAFKEMPVKMEGLENNSELARLKSARQGRECRARSEKQVSAKSCRI